MEPKLKPIPAFYCCYLLRSTIRHASLYVGSTPHPSRRLAQHNGVSQGGAVRTSRTSLRPWEMTCIVAGFPSNIAALQFEWAWQNSHLTRHISNEERISFPVSLTKTNARTGKTRKKPGRPRTSLVDRLSNLHLLLRTKYFSQWPLELRFFCEDVYRAWHSWCGRVDTQLSSGIRVTLDLAQATQAEETITSAQKQVKRRKADLIGKGGVNGLDPTYARFRDVFDKLQFIDEEDLHHCDVCRSRVDLKTDLFSICTANDCSSISHVTCLSENFLRDSQSSLLIPSKGHCPACKTELIWSDLMRVVSLRIRGDKDIGKLLKKRRQATDAATATGLLIDDGNAADSRFEVAESDESEREEYDIDDLDDFDDNASVTSVGSLSSMTTETKSPLKKGGKEAARLEIVIEDSEDERR